jgi:ribosome-associated toxin RatA of RatAB toxin-antitoxin module
VRRVEVIGKVRGLTCGEVYARLSDFANYPKFSPAVRSVIITRADDGRFYSDWEVNFREGILRWKEEDVFRPEERIFSFSQIQGDIDYFVGEWSVTENADGCLIRFVCDFDMGMPGLNDILEPIAEQALRDNAKSIVKGLVPPVEFIAAQDVHAGEAAWSS